MRRLGKRMINTNYRVSIITVVYNGVNTIEQTIQSVMKQTYNNIEYIVIDGGSTDGTQQIIEKYVDNISYYISEKDDGLYYAMNKGIEMAAGDIVGIINADDWYVDDAVESMVSFFEQNDVELAYGKILMVLENNKEKVYENMQLESIWYQMPVPHPSVFVKKDLYNKLGGFDVNYRLASDYELMLRFYTKQIKFGYVDKVIAYFRAGGLSGTRKKEMYKEVYDISMSYVDECPDKIQVLLKIKEMYRWRHFSISVKETKGLLYQLLDEYFDEKITVINIFGTGVWGKNCYKILISDGMEILYFIDNDMSKWNTDFQGIKVISPDKLRDIDVPILIAVKEHGEVIKRQLKKVEGTKLKCVSLEELATIYLCEDHKDI